MNVPPDHPGLTTLGRHGWWWRYMCPLCEWFTDISRVTSPAAVEVVLQEHLNSHVADMISVVEP